MGIAAGKDLGTAWTIILMHQDLVSGVFNIYTDGVLTKTGSMPTGVVSDANGFYLGSNAGAFNFKLPLFMVGKTDISADAQKLIGWAAHKYNLTSVLPADHPYKTEPPLV